MTRYRVGPEDVFETVDREIVTVEGVSIGVFRVGDEYFAIENDCCHLHGPVCDGKVQGKVVAEYRGPEEGVVEHFAEVPVIACPWHGWEYELATGQHVGDETIALRTFDVVLDDGDVFIEVDSA